MISNNKKWFHQQYTYITEIVLVSQEIIQEIGSANVEGNVVFKLEIDKDYDRVSWPYM